IATIERVGRAAQGIESAARKSLSRRLSRRCTPFLGNPRSEIRNQRRLIPDFSITGIRMKRGLRRGRRRRPRRGAVPPWEPERRGAPFAASEPQHPTPPPAAPAPPLHAPRLAPPPLSDAGLAATPPNRFGFALGCPPAPR